MMKEKLRINHKTLYMLISVLLCTVAMNLVDGVMQPHYFVKSIIKVCLFLIVPIIYFAVNREDRSELKKLFTPRGSDILKALGLGILLYGFILGGYFLLRNTVDFSGIVGKLTADTGVSADNFVFVALYISFVNSFLEEIFFRGFAFISLKKLTSRRFAYIFSALVFAFYHAAMTAGYFHIGIFALTLFGLFVAGFIFNYLNEKSENIYTSWIVHMFANFAINTVGFILFGIL